MTLTITFAQMNATVGDLTGNMQKMLTFAKQAQEEHSADVIIFPELAISGYPPEDLLFRASFIEDCYQTLLTYASATPNICSIVGLPIIDNGVLKNAAAVLQEGKITLVSFKQELPNYGVFDEKRYFSPGDSAGTIQLKGITIGIAICEDIWESRVTAQLKNASADIIITLNASPFEIDKSAKRINILQSRIDETASPILYVNCIGGQDELVFDGHSMLLDNTGNIIMQLPSFEEKLGVFQLSSDNHVCAVKAVLPCPSEFKNDKPMATIYKALKLGLQDYVHKNGFKKVIIGSSGGIDSAVTLAIAVDALGAENVLSVMMPSKYTAQMSLDDAALLAKHLEIQHEVIAITECFNAFLSTLSSQFNGFSADKTEENLQARCRGTLLMALSNKLGHLVLTTGNRSELAVGYATLYGDMVGGFSLLKDLYKTSVYALAQYINREKNIIPENIIIRPPSAELAEDQKDEDSLPPYPILDAILALYLDNECSINDIVAKGFDQNLVKSIVRMVHLNEYKRQQAPPGIRIHHQAFGHHDRRYPVTQRYNS